MKFKYGFFLLFFLTLFLVPNFVWAEGNVDIYFFYGEGCPHCEQEAFFLDKLAQENINVNIHRYETYYNADNASLLRKIGDELKADVKGVPVTFIEDEYISGYLNEEVTGVQIREAINKCQAGNCTSRIESIINGGTTNDNNSGISDTRLIIITVGGTIVIIVIFVLLIRKFGRR